MSKLKHILQNKEEADQEQVLKYLHGDATPEEIHAVEKEMIDSDFLTDAMEGLNAFKHTSQIDHYAKDINSQLRKQTATGKNRMNRRGITIHQGVIIAIVLILLICLLGYWILSRYNH